MMDRDGLVIPVSARQAEAALAAVFGAIELGLEFQRWAVAAALEQRAAEAANADVPLAKAA